MKPLQETAEQSQSEVGLGSVGITKPERMIQLLQQEIENCLAPLIGDISRCAILDYPDHSNVGDSMIWLGEMKYLSAKKIHAAYTCDIRTYSKKRCEKAVGDGVILIHGGGNFGDIWEECLILKERIVRDFPNNWIIQLPQTVYFKDRKRLEQAKAVFKQHSHFTLLVRDQRSYNIAVKELEVDTSLCPDMAFMLGSLNRYQKAVKDSISILRTDRESAINQNSQCGARKEAEDWLAEKPTIPMQIQKALSKAYIQSPRTLSLFSTLIAWTYGNVAQSRLKRGCGLVNAGRVVITDRLHVMILCILLNIPHVVLDNSYGKLGSYYETWLQGSCITHIARDYNDALMIAKRISRS